MTTSRLHTALLGASIAMLSAMGAIPTAAAATYTWDASGAAPPNDGSGNWNSTGGANWLTGSTYGAWGNTNTDVAVFGVGSGAAGTVTVGSVITNAITFNAAGSGSYLLSGGTIAFGGTGPTITTASGVSAEIASSATSSSSLTTAGGGTLTISNALRLAASGTLAVGHGEVVLASGAAVSNAQTFSVGTNVVGGTGTLRIQSGGSLALNNSSVGNSIGSVTLPQAAFVQEGGSVTLSGAAGSLTLGSWPSQFGTYSGSASYTMQGGSLTLNNASSGFLSIGRNAPSTFTQSGGTVALGRTSDALSIGDYSTGTYEMSGGSLTGTSTSANAQLGIRGGTGTLTITNSGSFGIGGSMFLAVNSSNSPSAKGSATINLQGGDLAVNGMTRGRAGTTGANGAGTTTFNFSGGTLRPYSANTSIGSSTAANNFSITLSGTDATLSGIDRATAASRTLDVYATLDGSGNVTVSGGLVNLRGTNTLTGLTSIASGGTAALLGTAASASGFRVNGTLDLSSKSSGFTFGSAQTVSGTGTIALPTSGSGVALAGSLAPGNSPGTLAFTGAGALDLTQAIDTESSRLLFELGSIGTSDLVTIASGTLAIGSGLLEFSDFAFTAIDGFGQGTYTLFSANAITGSLGSARTGAIGSYTGTLDLSGNQIQLVVVPEPAAITLAFLGVAAAARTICRRRVGNA